MKLKYWAKLVGIELFEALVAKKLGDHGERLKPWLFEKPVGVASVDG